MVIVHGTRKLLDRVKEPLVAEPSKSTTALGAWYATVLFWKPNVALFVNEATRLPVRRAGSLIVSGAPVHRPRGQVFGDDGRPQVCASRMLDFELEVGFVVEVGKERGHPITVDAAAGHVSFLVLVNDWSARDLQAFEQQPLGPFLGKSFATAVSPWVVTLDALRPYFTARQRQEPPPADYLHETDAWGVDLQLEADLHSVRMHGHCADALGSHG